MGDEQAVGMKTYRIALRARSGAKHFRGDETARNAATVEFPNVMQTARRARSSVGQAFNYHITLTGHLLQQRDRRRTREGGLLEAQYFYTARRE